MVTDIALVLGALKFVTILTRYVSVGVCVCVCVVTPPPPPQSTLQNLLTTVGTTILNSLSLLGVIGGFIITYAFVGVVVFSPLRSGEAINYRCVSLCVARPYPPPPPCSLVTFNGVWTSINLVIRVMTGEDWHQLLWDSMVTGGWGFVAGVHPAVYLQTQEPYCSQQFGNCGNVPLAILWFLSYYIFVPFILLNVVIAVLLENFSIFYNEDDTALSHAVVKDFKYNWKYFDSNASVGPTATLCVCVSRLPPTPGLHPSQPDQALPEDAQATEPLHTSPQPREWLEGTPSLPSVSALVEPLCLQERESCSLASDSLMLREMAEELLRECRQGGGGAGRGEGGGAEGKGELTPENLRHNFQSVLK